MKLCPLCNKKLSRHVSNININNVRFICPVNINYKDFESMSHFSLYINDDKKTSSKEYFTQNYRVYQGVDASSGEIYTDISTYIVNPKGFGYFKHLFSLDYELEINDQIDSKIDTLALFI